MDFVRNDADVSIQFSPMYWIVNGNILAAFMNHVLCTELEKRRQLDRFDRNTPSGKRLNDAFVAQPTPPGSRFPRLRMSLARFGLPPDSAALFTRSSASRQIRRDTAPEAFARRLPPALTTGGQMQRVAALADLRKLSLDGTKPRTLAPLRNLQALESPSLQGGCADLSPLREIQSLSRLVLTDGRQIEGHEEIQKAFRENQAI